MRAVITAVAEVAFLIVATMAGCVVVHVLFAV